MQAALIGVGMVSDTYLRVFADPDCGASLHGFAARSEAAADAFAARAQAALGEAPRRYADADEIAADPRVDFVVLATPPDAREAFVKTFARAGKPVLLEKPIERDLAAARRIVETCAEAGVPLGVVLQHRARATSRLAKARLGAGEFGACGLVSISAPYWRGQEYYDQPGRGTYARDGGGVLISQAIHATDIALWLAGPVAAVTAMARTSRFHRMEAEDFVVAGLEFESGALGSLTASTALWPGAAESVGLQTEAAALHLQSDVLRIDWRDGRTETLGETAGGTGGGADPMAFTHAWHRDVVTDFAQALGEGRPPLAPGREVLVVHRLIEAVALSSREGRRVELAELD